MKKNTRTPRWVTPEKRHWLVAPGFRAKAWSLAALLLLACLGTKVLAQVPTEMNYQGRLVDVTGVPLADGNYELVFNIFDANSPPGGTRLWGPLTNSSVPLVGGSFNVRLGNDFTGRPLSTAFGGATAFLEIQVGTNAPLKPRQQVLTAPYAFRSGNSDQLNGMNWLAVLDNADPTVGKIKGAKLQANSVATSSIADGSVTDTKLANNAVTTAKILDGSVTASKFATTVGAWPRSGNDISYSAGRVGIGGAAISPYTLTLGSPEPALTTTAQLGVFNSGNALITMRNTTADVETQFGVDTGRGIVSVLSDHPLVFRAGNGAGAGNVEYMRVNNGGNVGVGTTTPSAKLDVNGSVHGVNFQADAGTAASCAFAFGAADPNTGFYHPSNNTVAVATAGIERLRVDSSGNVGVGNAAPTAKLDISGSVRIGAFPIIEQTTLFPSSGSTVNPTTGYVRLSAGGALTLSSTTAIANGTTIGQVLILQGNGQPITIPNNANTTLGATSRALGHQDVLMLIWDGSDWVEISFSNNSP